MSEVKKITDTELQFIKSIRVDSLEVASVLGELEFQKILLEDQIQEQRHAVLEIKRRENAFLKELKDKYGNVTLNIETGEIE